MGGKASVSSAKRFSSRVKWRAWLKKNHDDSTGIWLVIAKKHAAGVHYEEAVEEALCFGWIDSTVKRLDSDFYKQWYSPRKPKSNWSKNNKQRVARLIKDGRMAESGFAAIRLAKENGSWEQLDTVEQLDQPEALMEALAANTAAREFYERLAPSYKKQYLYWINSARHGETRDRRIRETVRRLEDNIKPGA